MMMLWALLLIVQNATFTLVSRARNSGSLAYHALAAIGSNGVWFASQFVMIGVVFREMETFGDISIAATVYTASTVLGSVGMHWFSMHYIESGKRRVGS